MKSSAPSTSSKVTTPSTTPNKPCQSQKKNAPQIIDILDNQLEQLADELTRRRGASSANSTPTTPKKSLSMPTAAAAAAMAQAAAASSKESPVQRKFSPSSSMSSTSTASSRHISPKSSCSTATTPSVGKGMSHPFANMYHPRTAFPSVSTTADQLLMDSSDLLSRKSSSSSSGGGTNGTNSRKSSKESTNSGGGGGDDDTWQDPGQLLNAWLGELDSLRKGLECGSSSSRPLSPNAVDQLQFKSGRGGVGGGEPYRGIGHHRCTSPSLSMTSTSYTAATTTNGSCSRESSATPVHMRRMSTPRVESPRLDSYRYSLINLEDTLDNDLDAILGELCALESNFNTAAAVAADAVVNSSKPPTSGSVMTPPPPALPPSPASHNCLRKGAAPPPPVAAPSSSNQPEPEYITAEVVRQNKMAAAAAANSQNNNNIHVKSSSKSINAAAATTTKRTDSPDNDSAFCDNASTSNSGESGGGNDKANKVALTRLDGHMQLPVSAEEEEENGGGGESRSSKAEKIRIAIEKIKEASIKKIFIKVFGEDGSAKSLLVDERMSVSQVCRMLADKNHVKRDTNWALVELLPDLHMERAYEDHEQLVENLLMWKADSKNTLWFIKRPEVHDIFSRPEMYLLGETSSQIGLEMDERARAELVEEYFSSTGVGAPEVEGFLWLKAESKKSWKKFHFVLRTSGLYYAPKSSSSYSGGGLKGHKGHNTKDLVCLARFDVNQVYYGVKWQAKFKSPTRHCFAIKHPQIQAKNPKYIRYLAADTEQELNKWVTGIRVAKYGRTMYENYRAIVEEIAHEDIDRLASSRLSVTSQNGLPAVPAANVAANASPAVTSAANQAATATPAAANPTATVTDGGSGGSCHSHIEPARTPDSNENKSFDSAFQMSEEFAAAFKPAVTAATEQQLPSSSSRQQLQRKCGDAATASQQLMQLPLMKSSLTKNGRSESSGSLSEQSSSGGRSSVEHGFNCDSPEGGTIKKKPDKNGAASKKSNLVSSIKDTSDSNSRGGQSSGSGGGGGGAKPQKGVRFLDSYATIPPSPPSETEPDSVAQSQQLSSCSGGGLLPAEDMVYNNIDQILATNRSVLAKTSMDDMDHFRRRGDVPPPLQRRYSNESLASNPAMLHSGTLVHADVATPAEFKPSKVKAVAAAVAAATTASGATSNGTTDLPLSPQPDRPAPVLKPSVARKPSIDKTTFLARKQSALQNGNGTPTYEDTLKKCQSLTRNNSAPPAVAALPNTNITSSSSPNKDVIVKQNSCPLSSSVTSSLSSAAMTSSVSDGKRQLPGSSSGGGGSGQQSPALPPKPNLASLRNPSSNSAAAVKKVVHLPPSGQHQLRSNSANGRLAPSSALKSQHHQLNQAFLNDLHSAMASKLSTPPPAASSATNASSSQPTPPLNPFPNRFSSGSEYDNLQQTTATGSDVIKAPPLPPPAIPKRSNDPAHLQWNRS